MRAFFPLSHLGLFVLLGWFTFVSVQGKEPDVSALPHIIQKDGRHALIVDGAPFLILGVQAHNSSAWPATLPAVWTATDIVQANTLEIPVYWEQLQPEPGAFDFSIVDTLVKGAREHHVRLVLLWFGTWKNGSSHYLPLWMKAEPAKYPRILDRDGHSVDSPSPHVEATLQADKAAFRALMHHLKVTDSLHTVIMVQVENEPGAWNAIRDYSPAAQKLFSASVPTELLNALGLGGQVGHDWTTVFGKNADEFFQAWSVARFIGQVAEVGKAEYPLPLYVNAALRDPLSNPPAGTYESGGPTDNVIAIWKAAAPAVDLLAPDIYFNDTARYSKVLDLYDRPDNPLFVPETIRTGTVSRYCYLALAHGAIGWSPFGIDNAASIPTLGETLADESAVSPLGVSFRALGSMMRVLAKLDFEGSLHAVVEEKEVHEQTLDLGKWQAKVSFGVGHRGKTEGNPQPVGRVLIASLADNQFLVTGYLAHLDFQLTHPAPGQQREYVRVEKGIYEGDVFHPLQIWNGDEADWGLSFDATPQVVRVTLGTY